ncbi:MAG: structural protein P5 [Bacteroides sp.]|nr:structural protein P5 [Bacteroides sp.]
MKPRGIRNNNPLNIRHSADQWQGATEEQTDKLFVQFKSMAYGYRAAWKTLQSYYNRFCRQSKPFTVQNIIHRWAPPNENKTEDYIRTVLAQSGIGAQENLLPPENVDSYHRLSKLLEAMTVIENGIPPNNVNTEAIFQGYKLAFPTNATELDEWMLGEDEYREW